jgi:hypothetical protein
MSEYSEFFLNGNSYVAELELIEISHPNFTQTYYLVRNAMNGVTVTLENDQSQPFQYYPLQITPVGNADDLDQAIQVQLGDLGDLLPQELAAIRQADGFATRPQVIYRTYRSDDLTTPLYGPMVLEVTDLTFKREGAAFEARAPRKNSNSTGEFYTTVRFPMLRGFI